MTEACDVEVGRLFFYHSKLWRCVARYDVTAIREKRFQLTTTHRLVCILPWERGELIDMSIPYDGGHSGEERRQVPAAAGR